MECLLTGLHPAFLVEQKEENAVGAAQRHTTPACPSPPSEGTVDTGLPMVPSLPTWVGSLTPSLMLSQAHHGLSRLGLTQPNTAKAGQKYEALPQALLAAAAPEFELCSHFPPRESPKKASSLQPLPAWHHAACPRPQHAYLAHSTPPTDCLSQQAGHL